MTCSSCAHENHAGAKFCEECGTPLGSACANCGTELRPAVKFCSECGTPVAAGGADSSPPGPHNKRAPGPTPALPSTGTRKIVTIVFADLAGSTAMQERLDPESVRRFMESYYEAMRDAVESHGGTVTQFLGDGVKAVFGIPRVAEDDAIRAVRAGVAMQKSFQALAERQRGAVGTVGLRVAVNTGEVVANADDEIIGDPVNVAARLQEQGGNGDVVVGDSTARLVGALVTLAPLGSFALKGRAELVAAFLVESLEPPASAATAAFVGRDEELVRLTLVYESAIEKPATSLAVLLGSPGLGKSRLIDEFSRRLGDSARLIEVHCEQANSATFAPLAATLRELLAIEAGASAEALTEAILGTIPGDDQDRTRIANGIAALLAGSPGSIEETFFVVRRLFASLASVRPVVLVIDDLQWAEPLLLDLLEHLVQWGSGVPMLVLVGARPELRDKRVSLTIPGGLVSDVVALTGLDAGAAMRLAANVIGAESLPAAVAAKVLATSEGNPLFVGELVRMLVHEGALKLEGDRWTTGTALAALEMPPTIHALLAARIERLQPEERVVLERASVVGRQFSRSAVLELLPGGVSDLDARLETLRRGELIERDSGWFFGEPVLRFHHVLIRDAAYRQLLKDTRAELHTRFADWALARAGGSVDHDETIGWHLEQAHQFLRELGPIDAKGRVIGERASTHLAAAGRRALAGDDVSLAASLLGRAIDRLDPANDARAELALDWCEALLAAGDVGASAAAIDELDRFVGDSERLRAWHTCFASQLTVLTAPEGLQSTAELVAAAAESLASLGDAAGEAKAHFVHALALASLGKIGACEAALDRALAAARRVAGDRRRANTVLAIAPLAALWGPSPVTRASGRCLDVVRVLRITQGAPAVEAVALSCQGVLEALRGRTDAARRMIASARTMVEELGITQRLLEVDVFSGQIDLLEGDAIAAEASLRGAYDGLRELGLGIDAAQAAALLARALLAQDRNAEAETLSHESEALAGDDLKAAIAWRGVRAEALARRGEHAVAVAFASKAVEIAAATDALLDHADARLALAAALRAAGRGREADAEERRANELWEAKGATLLAERERGDGAPIISVPASAEKPIATKSAIRRIPSSAATLTIGRLVAAAAERDFDGVRAIFSDSMVETDHSTGSSFGPDEAIASLERLFRSRDPQYEMKPLAALGESLLLTWRRSSASGATSKNYDVGPYEHQALHLLELDERGLIQRAEVFSTERLNDAIACLYDRYAERLPVDPARERGRMTARSMTCFLVANDDVERHAAVLAPDFESVDHRHLSTWSLRGADTWLDHMRALAAVADDVDIRATEILALEPSAMLIQRMHSGTERVGGGAYERPFLVLFSTGPDGRLIRAEWFDADRDAEALSRFDELTAAPAQPQSQFDRIPSNRATDYNQRLEDAIEAQNAETIASDLSEDFELVHHATGVSYGAPGFVGQWQAGYSAERFDRRTELLGTLGDSLALGREWTSVSGLKERDLESFGPTEIYDLFLTETDERGRCRHIDIFAPERLGSAIARIYERYAALLPEGDGRDRAAATAHSIAALLGPPDLDTWSTAWSPAINMIDHRILGFGRVRGIKALREYIGAMFELEDFGLSVDDAVRLQPNAMLIRTNTEGTARASGGAYERPLLQLWTFGTDGLLTRFEYFEVERAAEAMARFHELTSTTPSTAHFANDASRAIDRSVAIWMARDWDGLSELLSLDFRLSSRRQMFQVELDRDQYREYLRPIAEMTSTRLLATPLATRGTTLALARLRAYVAEDDIGPSEIAHLNMVETDGRGSVIAWVQFDVDDPDAAYAELDARFEAGEATAHPQTWKVVRDFVQGVANRDWDSLLEICAPEVVVHDHRGLAVLGTTRGAEAWVASCRALVELAPDTIFRVQHFLPAARGYYIPGGWYGRREGSDYEMSLNPVVELDERGRVVRIDLYDDGDNAALERLAELAEPATSTPLVENAATRAAAQNIAAWLNEDWERFENLFPADFSLSDRRRSVQLELDREQMIAFSRSLGETATTRIIESDTLATRGDRLALLRWRIEIAGGDVGSSELVHLNLFEVDEHGVGTAMVRWDETDLDAAHAELDARFAAIGSNDARDPRAVIENPNAASATMDRFFAAYVIGSETGEWETMRRVCSPACVFEDRRRMALLKGDRELAIASAMERAAIGARLQYQQIGTAGDRVVMLRVLLSGGPSDGRFEIEYLGVFEVDEAGLLIAFVLMDLDEPRAVQSEAWVRWAAIDPRVFSVVSAPGELVDAFNEQDADKWRAQLADDLVVDDHRLAGMGRIAGPEAYTASVVALWEIAPITHGEMGWDWLAFDHYGGITVLRRTGTVPDGGGEFESENLYLFIVAEDRVTRVEMFELAARDEALARFEALRPDPAPAPLRAVTLPAPFANAATRVVDLSAEAIEARDMERFGSLFAPQFRNFDRRALMQIEVDRETWLDANRQILEMTTGRPTYSVLATRGERLAIVLMLWKGAAGDVGPSEIDWLHVIEVDEHGDHIAVVTFDPEDLDAAYTELDVRWAAGEGSLHPRASAWVADFQRGFQNRDWEAMAALSAPDQVSVNHRLVGWGTLRGQGAWVPTLEALVELAADTQFQVNHLRTNESGALVQFEWRGTREGGAYEIPQVLVVEVSEQGQQIQMDLWDDEKLELALARFEDVRPDPMHIPPNAATRARDEIHRIRVSGGFEALRELVTEDFCFDDRKRRSLVRGGTEEWLRALQFLGAETNARVHAQPVATAGDRLALDRVVWREAPGDGPFEIEGLRLVEVDGAGQLRALMLFDTVDRSLAHTELFERYVESGAEGMPSGAIELARALNDHDLGRIRAVLPDNLVVEDHRRTGIGRLEGAEAWIASVVALYELGPDVRIDDLYHVAVAAFGRVSVGRVWGTNTEGGEFESVLVRLFHYRAERIVAIDVFEIEDLELALARFEELDADRSDSGKSE